MNDHIKITNESPAPKCNWPTGACWHIHPEAEERAMLEHKQINDDAAARLIAAIPNYQGTQVNQTIHPMSDEEQESRLYLSSYDALSPHEQTLAHHQRDWKLAVDQAALAPQTGEVTLSSQVILDVDRRLRATPSPAADRERAITGEPPEVTLLHEEIESWRKLVEDYKREMKLWASGKVFRDLYPNSPLLGAITGEPVASQKYLEHEKTRSIAHGVMNALAGDIDKAFGSIIGSRIPDSIHVYLVELTHAAVDMSFAALRSDPPDRELLWQAFEYLEGYAIFEEERGHSSTAEGCRASAGAISRLLRAAPITGETSRDVAAEGESDAEHRILDAVSAYVDACEENGSNPGPDSDAATEASWASLTSIVRAACEGTEPSEKAPPNNLPDYAECALRVGNSDFIAKRVAEGGYGAEADSKLATELHRFIYEYDDADAYRSAWFLHRLERLLDETKAEALVIKADRERAITGEPVALTDERIDRLQEEYDCFGDCDAPRIHDFAHAIEAECRAAPITGEPVATDFERECSDTDKMLSMLGLNPVDCRTDGGSLHLPKIRGMLHMWTSVTDEMVTRFLGWKLPADFSPDAGITFKPDFNVGTPWPMKHEPFGTNLLNADQARAMLEHVLGSRDVAAEGGKA